MQSLPIVTEAGAQIPLGAVTNIRVTDGPASLKSENARLTGWIYVDMRGRDLTSVVADAKRAVGAAVVLPPGVSIQWSGQYEYLERAAKRLIVVVPFTGAIIFVLLYLAFRRFDEAALIMVTVPFALVGGFWYVYLLGHNFSVASAVGFIALAGLAAEFGVVMLIYLKQAYERRLETGAPADEKTLLDAVNEGAVLRVRPKAMTVAVILAGLAPIMWSEGTGAEIMQRIAAPMIGGMITAPLLSMFMIPAAYLLMRRPRRTKAIPAVQPLTLKGETP